MSREDFKALPVGTPVHVEFDGTVYDEGSRAKYPASQNHFAVSDGGYIHHLHRHSDSITVQPPPPVPMALGQVWRADNRNFVVYEQVGCDDGRGEFYLCGVRNEPTQAGEQIVYDDRQFRNQFPNARLLLLADGEVA